MLAWGRTTRLGCGFADYTAPGGLNVRLIVCNYKEGGNVVGIPMYSAGRPATQCGVAQAAPHGPVAPDGVPLAATTAPWWQANPWMPTPRDDEEVRSDARALSKSPARTHARGRSGVEATSAANVVNAANAVNASRAAVTRALPLVGLGYGAKDAAGHDTGDSLNVYPALCP